MNNAIIEGWRPQHAELFGQHTIQLRHRLAETGLFTEEALGELISSVPRQYYNLTTMGYDHENPAWREGEITGMSGKDVIAAIKRGRMWLNLRRIMEVDDRYSAVLDDIFRECKSKVPGLETFRHNLGILISSPNVQVFYHADVPGQALWQISGRKRIYIYPATAPFLKSHDLESILLGETEEEVHYEPWFDEFAEVFDLEPGQMLHWPLNGPHRVVNEDCLNISVTTEHWTREIRNSYAVNYANGVLRRYMGVAPRSDAITGLSVYPKAALALFWKKLGLQRGRAFTANIDFRADPASTTGMTDIPAHQKG